MAFTKTPITSTYQTKTISLFKEMDTRYTDSSKDVDYLNGFFESIRSKVTQEKDYDFVKRAGSTTYGNDIGGIVRGLIYWEDEDILMLAVGDSVVLLTASTGAHIITSEAFSTSSGLVGFSEFLYDDGTVKIVVTDGYTLSTVDNTGFVVNATDPDIPTPHLQYPVFLDGYLFLVKSGTADIYNSDLNDPLAWTTSNFISAEMLPDTIKYFSKLNNYLIVMGSDSIEYFWDAANESGSPLQRNDTPVKFNGILGGATTVGNNLYFVGNSPTNTLSLYVLEDFKIKEVSSPPINRYLTTYDGTIDLASDDFGIHSTIISFFGHDFLCLTIVDKTFLMELETGLWSRIAYQNTSFFDIRHACNIKYSSGFYTVFYRYDMTQLLRFDDTVYQDNGTNFTSRVVTNREMFDTYNQKTMNRLIVNSDKPTSSAPVSLSWSDDDYQTYNTPVSIDLYQELPCTYRLGRFRRRAFKLEFTQNQPLRIKNLEVDINMGQS